MTTTTTKAGESQAKATGSKAQPLETVRIGAVQAAIWMNTIKDGSVRFNATVERIYRDDQGNWQTSTSFGRDDLLLLRKVLDQAHTRIYDLIAAERTRHNAANRSVASR